MLFNINDRLKLVANYVKYRRLADIGSDHAYLPIYLAKNNKIDFAIAGEIVDGPYKSSIQNVKDNKLSDKIFCKKGSGLDVIDLTDNIEVITICGMGGKLISDILEKGKDKLLNKPQLILQPNVASNLVRKKLQELGYSIKDEDIIEEDHHIYEVIVASAGKMNLTKEEELFGINIFNKNKLIFQKKYGKELEKIEYILREMNKSQKIDEEKINSFMNYKRMIENVLNKTL